VAFRFDRLIKVFDTAVAVREVARRWRGDEPPRDLATQETPTPGILEARLTNVVVAALKEAFDRDHARLELERAQIEQQRKAAEEQARRAEQALRLEVRRQAIEREVARLRMLAGTAVAGWFASLLLVAFRGAGMFSMPAKVVLGIGWTLLIAAMASGFAAQGRLNASVTNPDESLDPPGNLPLWLVLAGLAFTAFSLLW
jgi:hypothetical protein